MGLLNYSTSIDVHKTLGEIQKILVEHGARKILSEYSNGRICELSFVIDTPSGERGIKLPASVAPVLRVLEQQKGKRKISVKVDYEQAERVAWRIIKDWIEAQMAILDTQMVKMEEVFFPYMLNNQGQTLFQAYEFKQLASGGTNE